MDSVAPEILHEIFKLACTDGGFTGCSLSLVSKHVRSTSRSARFHSVAVSGTARQLHNFLSSFSRERTIAEADRRYTPVVRHLFFAVAEGGECKRDWRTHWGLDKDKLKQLQAAIATARDFYLRDIATLFRLLSQDLHTLFFVHCHGWSTLTNLSGIECSGGFPALRELTIIGDDPFVSVAPAIFYPSLTYLHIDAPSWVQEKLPSWAERSPRVTHLCLSNINIITAQLKELAGQYHDPSVGP